MSSFRQARAVVLSRSGPNADAKQLRLGHARRQELASSPPSRRRPPNEYMRIAVASRVAGRFVPPPRVLLCALARRPAGAGIGADEVVFQHGLEVGLLPDLLEEGEPHLGVVDRDIARPQHGPALSLAVGSPEAGRQEPKRSARPLEIRNCRPAFPHQVDERRVERVRSANAVPQR